jgi:hypothetical protein
MGKSETHMVKKNGQNIWIAIHKKLYGNNKRDLADLKWGGIRNSDVSSVKVWVRDVWRGLVLLLHLLHPCSFFDWFFFFPGG